MRGMDRTSLLITCLFCHACFAGDLPQPGLLLDLDAERGVTVDGDNRVTAWANQAPGPQARRFQQQDQGRKQAGEGRPTLRTGVPGLKGKPALVFRQQELVCTDEDSFDGLSTGKGHTWIAILAAHEQRVGVKDVNSFFGNLRNGGHYEGIWGCLDDDNRLWWGARNGISFGRFDANNPKVVGPQLTPGTFHLVAGRMASGTASAKLELFVDGSVAIAAAEVPVHAKANPSKMAVGQERDAIEHPGHESFDGEIARLLIWERPLPDDELAGVIDGLMARYGLNQP